MDDNRTQDQLDALADLFLTGTRGDAAAAPRATGTDVRDQLQGPAPIRLGPKRVPPRPRNNPAKDGPRLRLHRPDPEDHESQPPAPPSFEVDAAPVEAVVEAVLLGNLPGFGGPWLTQYAQLLADEHGPVVILHVDDQRLDAELVQPSGSNTLSGFEFSAADDAGADSVPVVEMLEVLLRLQPTPARMMLVNLLGEQATVAPRLTSMKLWTVLTGHDDLATTAAARLLEQAAGDRPVSDMPGLGLMVMGSDEAQARTAAATVNALLSDKLASPLPLVGHLRQMGPVNVKQLGSFAATQGTWPALCELFAKVMPQVPAFEEALPAPAPAPATPTPKPPPQVTVKPRVADAVKPPRAKVAAPTAEPATPVRDDWALRDDAPRMKPRPKASGGVRATTQALPEVAAPRETQLAAPASAPHAPHPTPHTHQPLPDDPDLALVLLDAAGGAIEGVSLEARCPRHGAVQLLLDTTGQLHLLKRHSFDRDGNGDGIRAALLELIETESWTREHRQLLALASRPHTLNDAARPRLHLFTDRADLVTPLIGRTDLPLKLHLLQEVDLPTGSAWFCSPLS